MASAPADAQQYSVWRFRLGPPGALTYAATIVVIAAALEASSRGSDIWEIALLWLLIGGVWADRLGIALSGGHLGRTLRAWPRWLGIPLAFALAITVMWSRALFDPRRELSRAAFDAVARDLNAGQVTHHRWIGLYPTLEYQRTANGFRFVVADGVFDRHGYAYAANGEPILTEANVSPEWTGLGSSRSAADGGTGLRRGIRNVDGAGNAFIPSRLRAP